METLTHAYKHIKDKGIQWRRWWGGEIKSDWINLLYLNVIMNIQASSII